MSAYKEGDLVLYTEDKFVYLLRLENSVYSIDTQEKTWNVSLVRPLNTGTANVMFRHFRFMEEEFEPLNDEQVVLYEI